MRLEDLFNAARNLFLSDAFEKGTIPSKTKRYLERVFEISVPWHTILEMTLKEGSHIPLDRSWAFKNIYLPHVKVPGTIQEEKPLALMVSLDLSGSISDTQAGQFASAIAEAGRLYDKIIICTHGVEVSGEFEFENASPEEIYKVLGENFHTADDGTAFEPVIKRIQELEKENRFGIILFFTDVGGFDLPIPEYTNTRIWHGDVAEGTFDIKDYPVLQEYKLVWLISGSYFDNDFEVKLKGCDCTTIRID